MESRRRAAIGSMLGVFARRDLTTNNAATRAHSSSTTVRIAMGFLLLGSSGIRVSGNGLTCAKGVRPIAAPVELGWMSGAVLPKAIQQPPDSLRLAPCPEWLSTVRPGCQEVWEDTQSNQ